MKRYQKRSEVRVGPKKVVYWKKRYVGYTLYFGYRSFAAYQITAPETVARRKNGTIVVMGEIDVIYYLINSKDEHSRGTTRRCVIPGYFEDMDSIMKRLEQIAANKASGDVPPAEA
jgi:hypothetical protein